MKNIFIIYTLFCFVSIGFAQQTGKWGDQGDGTFRNPIIAADFSDPDVIRVKEDYYMVTSTFESSPGVTVLHSKDLVNWEIVGGVFNDLQIVSDAFRWDKMDRYNRGVYAPSIRFHDGKFWVFVNFYTDGFWMATANDPSGEWEVHRIVDKYGVPLNTSGWTDPCPYWDENGNAYLASSHPGSKWYGYIFQMTSDGRQLLDADFNHMKEQDIVYQYPDGGTLYSPFHSSEGNKIYKINGYYYLFHIEFLDSGNGNGTYVMRSRYLYGTKEDGKPGSPGDIGKYEIYKISEDKGGQKLPGQGALVDTPDGRWFWIAQFNKYNSDGRCPVLLPVEWVDNWPVIGVDRYGLQGNMKWSLPKPIQGYPVTYPQGGDDFLSSSLHPKWFWNHQPDSGMWSLSDRPGYLRLYASADGNRGFFKCRNTVSQRHMRSDSAVVTVKIDIGNMMDGQDAGLVRFNGGKNYAFAGISRRVSGHVLTFETDGKQLECGVPLPVKLKMIYFRTRVGFDNNACFEYSLNGKKFIPMGEVYKLKTGNYRGDMVGISTYSYKKAGGYIDADWFHYQILNK